jgi:hypothetical protein
MNIAMGASGVEVDIWFDAGEAFYDFSISLAASSGLDLASFDPDPLLAPTVSFTSGDGGHLILIDSSSFSIRSGPLRVGGLVVSGTAIGASLDLVDLPDVVAPSFTDAAFGLELIPVPQTVLVVVPEPGTALLLTMGLGLLVASRPARRD